MNLDRILQGKSVLLRSITLADCTDRYVNWLNDSEINEYLESRLSVQKKESVSQFVSSMIESDDNYMFAIVHKETGGRIGNVKIGPIHPVYKHAFVGYLIGDKNYWGKGLASEAVYLASKFCFDTLKLHKVNAGVIAPNIGSIKVLEKLGFQKEGSIRDDVLLDDKYIDVYKYGVLEKELVSP